jgi:hypothetical protein
VVSKLSEKSVTCVADTVGSGIAHAPRDRVKSASVVAPRSIDMSQTITLGRPLVNLFHTTGDAVMSSV